MMASLDAAGKTTNLYRMTLDTATTVTPATGSNVESVDGTQKPGAHCLGHWRTRRLMTRSRIPGQTASSSRKSKAFESCGVPIGILGRESRDPRGQRGME